MPRTRSSRVLWLLEEIGEPYELTEIAGAQRQSAEHLRRHPLGRVPALDAQQILALVSVFKAQKYMTRIIESRRKRLALSQS